MKKVDAVRKLLGYIGADAVQDKVFAEVCLMLLPEEKKPEEKPKKGRKAFDMGKLKALLDGGWSVPKIADEMKVSDQTIYNKMKQMEEQGND